MNADIQDAPIRTSIGNGVAELVFNRPSALNALNQALVSALGATLEKWRNDPAVHAVILRGEGGKAFSAGADVRAVWADVRKGDFKAVRRYFGEEYAIDLMLANYPKDCLAVVDGICFGGGMGLAVHSRYCVATEHARFAMPETLIGFFPDAGATHFLSRLPGSIGLYLGMTGEPVDGADAVRLGLASHYVSRKNLSQAVAAFAADGLDGMAACSLPPPPLSFEAKRSEIDACFSAGTVEGIFARLREVGDDWALRTLATLKQRSPASLRWTIESQQAGSLRDLKSCLAAELELAAVSTAHPDFSEGIRAALIDKDKAPRWTAWPRG